MTWTRSFERLFEVVIGLWLLKLFLNPLKKNVHS
jgi:hypothetical protein